MRDSQGINRAIRESRSSGGEKECHASFGGQKQFRPFIWPWLARLVHVQCAQDAHDSFAVPSRARSLPALLYFNILPELAAYQVWVGARIRRVIALRTASIIGPNMTYGCGYGRKSKFLRVFPHYTIGRRDSSCSDCSFTDTMAAKFYNLFYDICKRAGIHKRIYLPNQFLTFACI